MQLGIKSQAGQSYFDLCLMAYTTLDQFGKFISDNGIDDINSDPGTGKVLSYESILVFNQQQAGGEMATSFSATSGMISTGFNYTLDFQLD